MTVIRYSPSLMTTKGNILFMTLCATAALGCACKSKASEPAPVVGQEFLEYRAEGRSGTAIEKILIQPGDDGFTIATANKTGFEPQAVGLDLADGRRQIKALHLGWLWLAPSMRKIGAALPVGKVLEQTEWNSIPVFVVGPPGARMQRWYFHTETGFLVGHQTVVGGGAYRTMLSSTNIAGLPVVQ